MIKQKSSRIQPKSSQIKSKSNPNPNQGKILVDNSKILIRIMRILGNPNRILALLKNPRKPNFLVTSKFLGLRWPPEGGEVRVLPQARGAVPMVPPEGPCGS